MKRLVVLMLVAMGCTSAQRARFVYFPALGARVQAGDPAALGEVLWLSETTLPGAELEELAALASSYVWRSPYVFLRAQHSRAGCFGVSFLGETFVDHPIARTRELTARRAALSSVDDPELSEVKSRCLTILDGS